MPKENNPIDFIPLLSKTAGEYSFLYPTKTGLSKSILDATAEIRWLFNSNGLHDYSSQEQGPEHKAILPAFFVTPAAIISTTASLYRPRTKKGDPRFWIKGLGDYANPGDLLVLVTIQKGIYVLNLSNPSIVSSIYDGGIAWQILRDSKRDSESIKLQLLAKLREIHDQGWIPSVTPNDPGVGDTLEHALGLERNNSKNPDYFGIELKATRTTRHGENRQETRTTLFTRVPENGLSYREIVKQYGKYQVPRNANEPRLQLYETFSCNRVNGYGLFLKCDSAKEKVEIRHASKELGEMRGTFVSSWSFDALRQALAQKHPETFWVSADSKDVGGKEYFFYQQAIYTSKPNVMVLPELIAKGIITLDLAAHIDPVTKKWRDHGMLWKIKKENLPLLMGEEETYLL